MSRLGTWVILAMPLVGIPAAADARFPTVPGTYWVYRGTTGWTLPGTAVVEKGELTWRVEVTRQLQGEGFEVAVLKGFPTDLAWYEPGKQPDEYAVVILNGSSYYLIKGTAAVATALAAEDRPLVSDYQLLFQWPLRPGSRFGEPDSVARADAMYCWVVEDASRSERSGIERYRLSQRTLPDHQILEFVPGVGVVAFTYAHHGTVSYTGLRLIEFGRP